MVTPGDTLSQPPPENVPSVRCLPSPWPELDSDNLLEGGMRICLGGKQLFLSSLGMLPLLKRFAYSLLPGYYNTGNSYLALFLVGWHGETSKLVRLCDH